MALSLSPALTDTLHKPFPSLLRYWSVNLLTLKNVIFNRGTSIFIRKHHIIVHSLINYLFFLFIIKIKTVIASKIQFKIKFDVEAYKNPSTLSGCVCVSWRHFLSFCHAFIIHCLKFQIKPRTSAPEPHAMPYCVVMHIPSEATRVYKAEASTFMSLLFKNKAKVFINALPS